MDKKELQKLEDEHNRKLRDLERLEMDLDWMMISTSLAGRRIIS